MEPNRFLFRLSSKDKNHSKKKCLYKNDQTPIAMSLLMILYF